MIEQWKFPYESSQKKRFDVSSDEYSHERISVMKSFYEKLHQSFDVPMGLALFGSLAKGKELDTEKKDASDIDFSLYIDLDEYKKKYIENLQKKKNEKFLEFEVRRFDALCNGFHEKKLLTEGAQNIRSGKNLTLEQKDFFEKCLQRFGEDRFLFFLAIWHGYAEFSDFDGKPQKFSFQGKAQYPIERMAHLLRIKDAKVLPIQFQGEFSIEAQVEKVKTLSENIPKISDEKQKSFLDQERRYGIAQIACFFSLDIGGGMKPYRQDFIRKLLLLPQEEGERLWNIVNDSVRVFERSNEIPEHIERQFPKNLQEAARYYGVQR